jgi:YegS/Rv2252/BmrU family lipid kinase
VILNPKAGSKAGIIPGRPSEDQLRELLGRHDLEADVVASETEEAAVAAVREAVASGYDVVAAGGGDGTAETVAGALLGSSTALGILPLGSVMNFARSIGVPRDLEAAVEILARAPIRTIDVGTAKGRPFLGAGSVGINAAVFAAQRFHEDVVSSLSAMLVEAVRFRPARMRITFDDGRTISTRALMVAVSNAPYTGIGLPVAPGALLDDGLFDVRVFSGFSKLDLLRYAVLLLAGRKVRHPRIRTWRSRLVTVATRHPRPVRADAADLGTTPVRFEVLPGALRLVAPAPDSASPAPESPASASPASG